MPFELCNMIVTMVSIKEPILPPNILFREFESGRMSRKEFHAAMSFHAIELIDEMEEDCRNPLQAFVETIRNKRSAHSLSRKHGEPAVREIFTVLAELSGFPPARLLWNASHRHVPLHCFLRMKKKPIFRILNMVVKKSSAKVELEYQFDNASRPTRELILLKRGWHGNMFVEERSIKRR